MAVSAHASRAAVVIGPLLFNWSAGKRRDFYFRIADEAPVDRVCLGEVVCSKRASFFDADLPDVIERLESAGKEIVVSTLALATSARELEALRGLATESAWLVEANDGAALSLLCGRPHAIGPYVNVYNEDTLRFLARRRARRVVLPIELPSTGLAALAPVAAEEGVEIEVQVFGRLSLAISSRCYHARAHGLHKDGCQYVCAADPDGLAVETLDGNGFLAVNGLQTLSHGVANLIGEIPALRKIGVSGFRLSPHSVDMVAIAALVREVLDGREDAEAARRRVAALVGFAPGVNGFYHGIEGVAFLTSKGPAP